MDVEDFDFDLNMEEYGEYDTFPEFENYGGNLSESQFEGYKFIHLNDRDYSLNSPLISDELTEFHKYLNQKPFRDSWNLNSWKQSIKWIKLSHNPPDILIHKFHTFMGELFLQSFNDDRYAKKFLHDVKTQADGTKWIPDAFMKGIFQLKNPVDYLFQIPDYVYKILTKFLVFHWMTHLMNAKTASEAESLITTINSMDGFEIISPTLNVYHLKSPIGSIKFDQNFALFMTQKQLVSFTHILLMKDTLVARFNSLIYLSMGIDPLLLKVDIYRMIKIYKEGDQGLIEQDNDWYDTVGLIEPICNLRFVQTSHSHRPLIPLDLGFEDHIANKTRDLTHNSEIGRNFLKSIKETTDLGELLHLYGSFRHWGHPEINYLEGLRKLHNQVNLPKEIDTNYANALASDLAFLVLRKEFKKNHKWAVELHKLERSHPFFKHFLDNTFPTDAEVMEFGDNWHNLPLGKCFDIPDAIEPSEIYSDKSHSMTKSEVIKHLTLHSVKKIPSKRVLSTYLERPATNWKEFLVNINDNGFNKDDLMIGLKAKEREIKKVGRFFALMSWPLREYFVVTEFLIKKHYVPLFGGLTMADDFSTVTKKMLDRSRGQGLANYKEVCYANHIDYEKWNNHQRYESTEPVFKVMGQFLGLPNLFAITHKIFESSTVYYNGRPDLMMTDGSEITNIDNSTMVVWNGQKGGLEGLRQKGWSILNLLVIRREARSRSTKVSVLAQGDNQVVCTQYAVQAFKTVDELRENLDHIHLNNAGIMKKIIEGTKLLGLIINEDETIQGSDYLNYGKVPIWRGNICPLATKRWSRVCCVTNDQMPSMSNMMATVITNALTISNFSLTPIPSILALNFFGNFVLSLMICHNPAIRRSMTIDRHRLNSFRLGFLYLDPAIGGISGTNLNRFLIRGFPDPVTESLSFWRVIQKNVEQRSQIEFCGRMASVDIRRFDTEHFSKLLENPASLNLRQGISPETTIKEHIKKSMIQKTESFQNETIKNALSSYELENGEISQFLYSIQPCFPRFLSEFKAATFVGVTESILGLFQNSKTIRRIFRNNFLKDINQIIVNAEMTSIRTLTKLDYRPVQDLSQVCTSSLADSLRTLSWGQQIHGATVPHPSEMFSSFSSTDPSCSMCGLTEYTGHLVTRVTIPSIHSLYGWSGPHPPYLGSRTTEGTSILSPWEQESKIPIIEKAKRLRRSIGWFIEPNSKIASAILANLQSMTGEEWSDLETNFQRTGSALHRFGSERQSSGGYNAISPTGLSRMYTTTDFLSDLQQKNYDFMFQSSILYSQVSSLPNSIGIEELIIHHHVSCRSCVREIEEIKLDTTWNWTFRDHSTIINLWKPSDVPWIVDRPRVRTKQFNWDQQDVNFKSRMIGKVQGFIYGLLRARDLAIFDQKKIFPQVLCSKLNPSSTLRGILEGLLRASSLHILQRGYLYNVTDPIILLLNACLDNIQAFSHSEAAQSFLSGVNWINELSRIPHKTPASFPQNRSDSSYLILNYLRQQMLSRKSGLIRNSVDSNLIVFADINTSDIALPLALTEFIFKELNKMESISDTLIVLRSYSDLLSKIYNNTISDLEVTRLTSKIFSIQSEVRHSVKGIIKDPEIPLDDCTLIWSDEYIGSVDVVPVDFSTFKRDVSLPTIFRVTSPLMSGLRLFQFATGSHYKLRSILHHYDLKVRDVCCLGDGSGGLTALCLRFYPNSRCIFNSLVKVSETAIYGQEPPGPATIQAMGVDKIRCVNLNECTLKPNDLTLQPAWNYIKNKAIECNFITDLVVIDCETDEDTRKLIEEKLIKNIKSLLSKNGTLIYKTYLTSLYHGEILRSLGGLFSIIDVCQTSMTTLFSEEVYIICRKSVVQPRLLYPDLNSLIKNTSNFAPFRTSGQEFSRCKALLKLNLNQGIPPQLRLPNDIRLGEILSSLGVPAGISYRLSSFVGYRLDINKSIALLSTSTMFLLNTTSRAQSHLRPPSNSVCTHLLSLLYGFSYFLAWRAEDHSRFDFLNRHLVRLTPISFSEPMSIPGGKFQMRWSLSKKLNYTKAFYMDKEGSGITQMIRSLAHFPWSVTDLDEEKITLSIKEFNVNSSYDQVKRMTGVFDLIQKRFIQVSDYSNDANEPTVRPSFLDE